VAIKPAVTFPAKVEGLTVADFDKLVAIKPAVTSPANVDKFAVGAIVVGFDKLEVGAVVVELVAPKGRSPGRGYG